MGVLRSMKIGVVCGEEYRGLGGCAEEYEDRGGVLRSVMVGLGLLRRRMTGMVFGKRLTQPQSSPHRISNLSLCHLPSHPSPHFAPLSPSPLHISCLSTPISSTSPAFLPPFPPHLLAVYPHFHPHLLAVYPYFHPTPRSRRDCLDRSDLAGATVIQGAS